ncbi:Zn-ribbon domain-containing protein [Bacteroidota bacterium]
MPHQCVKCGSMYDDGSSEILQGCECGGKLFFYIKKSALERKEEIINLTKKEKQQIEDDIYDIIGSQIDKEKPIVLDIETIKILKPGKYEIDLVNLFKKQPLIYKVEEGKYVIDIIESFNKMREKK